MVLSGSLFQRVFPRAACTFLLLVSLAGIRAQPIEVTGTMPEDYLPELKKILAGALSRSPNLLEAQLAIEVREANQLGTNAARLPSLGANFSYGSTELAESGNTSSRSRDNGLVYGVSLNQPVFHWNALKNQSAIARINLLLAEKNLAKAYRELGVLLRRQYLGLIVQKARLRQSREALRLQRDNIDLLKERRALGRVSPADVSGAELLVREGTLALNRAEADLITARRAFGRLAGIGDLPEDAIPDDIPRPVFSEALTTAIAATLLRDGAKSTLEAGMHDLRVREALLRYRIASVGLLPKFNFGAGYSLENTTTVGNTVAQRGVARQSLSLGGSWPIFDGFATRAAKMEARIGQRAADARRAADLDLLQQQAQALERQLKLDGEELELADIRRANATTARDRVAEEVGFGKLPRADIDRADRDVLLAAASMLSSRAAFLDRWSEFVALASDDPLLDNLPARHAREKK